MNNSLLEQSLPDYSVTGQSDTTVFMLHCAFGAKEYWYYQIEALVKNGYRVVAWDAPGYGLSEMPEEFSIESLARVCCNLINALGTKTNIVMGHSMGGMIAQRAYDYLPEKIHGLVLSATSAAFGGRGGDWQKKFVSDRVAPLDNGLTIPEYAPTMLKNMMTPAAEGRAVDLVLQVVSLMREETFRAAIEAITHFEGRDVLPKMNVPVICIAGELDLTAAPPQVMEKMASKISDAEFHCMSNVGHFGWAENPQEFNRLLVDFLGRKMNVA